jgi:hypothetical protein
MLVTDAVATTLTKLGAPRHAETPRSGDIPEHWPRGASLCRGCHYLFKSDVELATRNRLDMSHSVGALGCPGQAIEHKEPESRSDAESDRQGDAG